MKRVLLLVAVLLTVGCSSAPKQYAECTVPVKRNAGMGVYVDGCAAWSFGPSRVKQAEFAALNGWRK